MKEKNEPGFIILAANERGSQPVADPGENLTGALHSNFECGGCG